MTVARDVDKFWGELNKKTLPKSSPQVKANVAIAQLLLKDSAEPGLRDQSDQQSQALVTTGTNKPAISDCSQLDLDGIEQRFQRDLQALKAPAAPARCQALRHITASMSA
ncbi:TPA: hypothetical protein ACH3X3_004416 [Trebouxia sp. C0006]